MTGKQVAGKAVSGASLNSGLTAGASGALHGLMGATLSYHLGKPRIGNISESLDKSQLVLTGFRGSP